MANEYTMTISRLTVDKLGVKLYDRVSAVIAELIANSYDADATEVEVRAPMNELLASKTAGQLNDQGYIIEVVDNGVGMVPDEVNEFYLKVGAERRTDPKRGERSKKYDRKVMGRKGVGKLAPFGVCQKIEVLTAGGQKVDGMNKDGRSAKGYLTAHLIMDRAGILQPTDENYNPAIGPLDGTISEKHGTTLRLTVFDHRTVPSHDDFERQLAQRFGLSTANWQIKLTDTSPHRDKSASATRVVGEFKVEKMPDTELLLERSSEAFKDSRNPGDYLVRKADKTLMQDISPGFTLDDKFYPLTGWIAYSKQPYRDDLMAGVRIYCRGKIAAQTHIFNLKAGFTGEYDIRSYLVGTLNADWLDEEEDLIRTDRQDILWSHELGRAFESWGQSVVKAIGSITREPRRKKAWEQFKEKSRIEERVVESFPRPDQEPIRDNTLEIAKAIARTAREDELRDADMVEQFVQLSLMLGPHITLNQKLREAANEQDGALPVIAGILKTARIAELSSFGRIAEDRVKVIRKVEVLKDDQGTLEDAFQQLITEAPWLVNPQWSPITANQSFNTMKEEFKKYYKQKIGVDLNLDDFSTPGKRPDFVFSNQDNVVEIIEIKKPAHNLTDTEMDRIVTYNDTMEAFISSPSASEFKALFPKYHITLVCDGVSLMGAQKQAFENLQNKNLLSHIDWKTFLLRTRKMHEAFLKEADRQRQLAGSGEA